MWLRFLIVLAGLAWVVYRGALWWEIRRAQRSGNAARERLLRTKGFRLYRWALLAALVFIIGSSLLVLRNGN